MVKVYIDSNELGINRINVKDHAGYKDAGQDLVCAGVSSIVFGMMNALELLANNQCHFQIEEADITIEVKAMSQIVNNLLTAMIIQLQTIEENYRAYIKIIR